METREPPVKNKPGPPEGRVPKMMGRPLFMIAVALIALAAVLAGFYA